MGAVHMHARSARGAARPGFTIIEIMTSILIVAVLISMLIVGLRFAGLAGRRTQQLATVSSLKQAVSEFRSKFGFLPPLVRDQDPQAGNARSVINSGVAGRWKVSVRGASAADAAFLSAQPGAFNVRADNPMYDPRFSVRTFAYYLAGALEHRFDDGMNFPIDGIRGAGAYPPRADGSFELPESLTNPSGGAVARKRTGDRHEPFVDMGRSDPKIREGADPDVPADTGDPQAAKIQLVDRNGVAYRFYRWELKIDPNTGDLVNPAPELIKRWFDRPGRPANESNPESLKTARYAIVGAGPDGVFGDEDPAVLSRRVGMQPAGDPGEMKLRLKAIEDNIVEVGE